MDIDPRWFVIPLLLTAVNLIFRKWWINLVVAVFFATQVPQELTNPGLWKPWTLMVGLQVFSMLLNLSEDLVRSRRPDAFYPQPPVLMRNQTVRCQHCGGSNSMDDEICVYCGELLEYPI